MFSSKRGEKKYLRNLLVSWEANIRARGRHVISKQQEGAFYILWSGGPTPTELKSPAGNHTLNPPPQIRIRKVRNKEQYPTHSTAQSMLAPVWYFPRKNRGEGQANRGEKKYIYHRIKRTRTAKWNRGTPVILLVVFTSAPSGFSKTTASPAPAWTAPVAAAGVMVSIWTAVDEATRTCTGNKVRQKGQYTVGANQKLKNWQRFTFPRPSERPSALRFCAP